MSHSFGTQFVIVNDVVQILDPKIFGGGEFIHLATVQRGLKEYMAYRPVHSHRVYIVELDSKEPELFKTIKEDREWIDVSLFLRDAQLLEIGSRKEMKSAYHYLPGAFNYVPEKS